MIYSPPYMYDYINANISTIQPNTLHVSDTGLSKFYQKYLFQKALSLYDWTIPDTWDLSYFLYVLYGNGYISVINTDKYGVIPQYCNLSGYNVFYQPNTVTIANPLLAYRPPLKIGIDCTLIKLQPDYSGIMDLVTYYANQMALCAETITANLVNAKNPNIFVATNDAAAMTYKAMVDKLTAGESSIIVDKNAFKEDGTPAWQQFTQSLKQNYIVSDVLEDMRKIEAEYDTEIGIPNANTDKRERLIVDEVNANNFETFSRPALWLKNLQKGVEDARNMFGLSDADLHVDFNRQLIQEVSSVESGIINTGDV